MSNDELIPQTFRMASAMIDHLRFTRGLWCALAIVGWICFAIAVLL